jgi:hypothetical protein
VVFANGEAGGQKEEGGLRAWLNKTVLTSVLDKVGKAFENKPGG